MTHEVLTHLSDEELLLRVYMQKPACTPLELELAQRLEHALNELRKATAGPVPARVGGEDDGSPD